MKVLLAVLAFMFALFVAAAVGAFWFFSGSLHSEARELAVPHIEGEALQAKTKNGSISVVRSDVEQVEITATIKARSEERLADSEIVAERDGDGTLTIGVAWSGGKSKSREGCSFKIQVPSGVAGVSLISSNGSLTCTGLAGDASLDTSNGKIKITNHDGPVSLETSNGKIEATGVTGSVRAKSSNGSLDIALADSSPGPVNLDTSNGSVKIQLSSVFSGDLKMDTSNGSIKFGEATGAEIIKSGKKHAEIRFGDSGQASSIDTSNGSITVRK